MLIWLFNKHYTEQLLWILRYCLYPSEHIVEKQAVLQKLLGGSFGVGRWGARSCMHELTATILSPLAQFCAPILLAHASQPLYSPRAPITSITFRSIRRHLSLACACTLQLVCFNASVKSDCLSKAPRLCLVAIYWNNNLWFHFLVVATGMRCYIVIGLSLALGMLVIHYWF